MSANNDAVNLQPGPPSVHAVLGKLWEAAGLDRGAAQRLTATGSEPVLRSRVDRSKVVTVVRLKLSLRH